ncbi:MAG: hypothetical protein AB7S81_08940 [Bdellovibrionales bacterium]
MKQGRFISIWGLLILWSFLSPVFVGEALANSARPAAETKASDQVAPDEDVALEAEEGEDQAQATAQAPEKRAAPEEPVSTEAATETAKESAKGEASSKETKKEEPSKADASADKGAEITDTRAASFVALPKPLSEIGKEVSEDLSVPPKMKTEDTKTDSGQSIIAPSSIAVPAAPTAKETVAEVPAPVSVPVPAPHEQAAEKKAVQETSPQEEAIAEEPSKEPAAVDPVPSEADTSDRTSAAVTAENSLLRDSRNQAIVTGSSTSADGTIEQAPIAKIGSESIGVLSNSTGGLGADMWQGTSRRMIDRLLPALELPVASPALNDLAVRFLLTAAAVPDDRQQGIGPLPDLTSIRVDKLLALGEVPSAWALSNQIKEGKLDDLSLRRLTHAALLRRYADKVCPSIPDLIAAQSAAGKTASEWQKALIFCQIKDDNKSAVTLGLDLLKEQKVKNDPFMQLVERNYLKKGKAIPKEMTPLQPLDLALLRHLGKTLPKELYQRASAVNVPDLLAGEAESDWWKLHLAEEEALRGQITAEQLIKVYQGISFSTKDFEKPLMSQQEGAQAHALYYQTALKQTNISARLQIIMKFLSKVSDRDLAGTMGLVLADLAKSIPVSEENGIFAAQGVRLYALAGDPDQAMKWRSVAKKFALNFAEVGVQLAARWPVFVFSGLEADGDYAQGMADWLFVSLTPGTPTQERQRRSYAGEVLLLLSAAGYAVPEEAWLRMTEAPPLQKGTVTSPVLLERLERVGATERKGETVLLSLILAGSEGEELSLAAQAGIVRALRLAGLEADAQRVAREAVASLKIP